jgi:competence protein ComEA
MILRIALAAAVVAAIAFALHRPAPRAPLETSSLPAATASVPLPADSIPPNRVRRIPAPADLVVYVTGAVRRPGLYHLHFGDRYARAVELAGGLTPEADQAAVNLAQPAGDGDEVDVAAVGAAVKKSPRSHRQTRSARSRAQAPPDASVDINVADAGALGAVPGIGRAVAARVVELRNREGPFASLDELLDVAGMTQGRLERARPYLRQP